MMTYKKQLVAVAVVAAFGLPFAAQADSSVTMYGKLYPEMTYTNISGASKAGTSSLSNAAGAEDFSFTEMQSSNSHFGLRGTEDISENLKAIFQLEMNVGINDGSGGSSKAMWNRNTFVGLQSDVAGTLKFGNMDTVYKDIGDKLSFLGISSGNFVANSTILSKQGFGTSSASSFHLRRNNAVTYESPSFAGFQYLAQWSKDTVDYSAPGVAKPWVFSTGIVYDQGPIYAALAYEFHKDLYGGSKNMPTKAQQSLTGKSSDDSAVRLTFGYKFTKDTRAEANIAQIRLKETGGKTGDFGSYKHVAWSLSVQHKIGATTLQASYGQATAGSCTLVGSVDCSTSGLDGKQFNLGASYALSKRTSVYAIASRLVNGESARYNTTANASVSPGADITQAAVGLLHRF